MTSRETLECRIYMAEDAMYRRSDELNRQLHELESRLKGLTDAVHRVLCEDGRTPLEVKTSVIVQAIEAFDAGTDLSAIRAQAERVTSLKGLVDDFEREIAEATASQLSGSAEDRHALELVATGS